MVSLILKPKCSLLTMGSETISSAPSGLGAAMLLLNRITGVILGGLGVTVLIANVLLGCVLLLMGPDFTLGLLTK